MAIVPARNVVEHPENISFEEAAASSMPYVTAWRALVEQAKLTQGDFLIVTAASSSVGIAAFQVAKAVGATVIATPCTPGLAPSGQRSSSREPITLLSHARRI